VFGFEAIAHHNGWSMAVAGASIVLSGLAILSFIISQLHKVVELTEKRVSKDSARGEIDDPSETPATILVPDHCPTDLTATAQVYKTLTVDLGQKFQLIELYALAKQRKFPHPHLDIRCLREAGLLMPLGDGEFKLTD